MSSGSEKRFKAVLAQIIQASAKRAGGYSPLQRQMNEVRLSSGERESGRLTRRQLKKIADGDDIPLQCDQLQVIDEFLRKQGNSLSSLLGTPYLVSALAEKGRVTFIIGSQPDAEHRRIDLSRWDIRAMREILNAVNLTGQTLHMNFEDVIFRESSAEDFSGRPIPVNETWHHWLTDGASSVVCLGSPKACHAAEVMLAEMFKVEAFRQWPENRPRPFYFVWPEGDHRSESIKSAFKRAPLELQDDSSVDPDLVRDLRNPKSATLAFSFDGTVWPVRRAGGESITYGLIAAQRRAGNGIWLCVCGLTGPGTFGAAQLLPMIRADLSSRAGSDQSLAAWAVVEVQVTEKKGRTFRHDERRVVSQKLLGEMRYVQS